MDDELLRHRVLEALTPRGLRIQPFPDLARAVLGAEASEADREALRGVLARLERAGEVVRVRGEKFSRIEFTDFTAGTLAIRGDGRAVVLSGERGVPDLPVAAGGLGSALDGDFVLARVEKPARPGRRLPRHRREMGIVAKVLVRQRETVVGKVARRPEGTVIIPFDRKIDALLRVPEGKDLGAPTGVFVEARVVAYPDDRRLALAEVTGIVGFEGDPGVDVEVVARKWGIPRVFPEAALREADAAGTDMDGAERSQRADFTGRTIVTIDGETARDFDDAIEAQALEEGGFRVGVHIADVAHYVPVGSALDIEAYERGTSVYFPDRAVPMLPERLSNDLCSLRPGEARRTVSVVMTVTERGETVKAEFFRSIIRSRARLTYTQVGNFLEVRSDKTIAGGGQLQGEGRRREEPSGGSGPGSLAFTEKPPSSPSSSSVAAAPLADDVAAMLRVAARAAAALRARRFARGSLDFDLPDADLILGEEGDVVGITKAVRNEAHRLIEEFMIAANEAVAKHLQFVPSPILYRVHDASDESRLVDLRAVLGPLGYDIPEDAEEVVPAVFQAILQKAEGKPEERFVSDLVLKAQRKAVYAAECRGHYALASRYYCHFTSPIRRFPDLLAHRALVEWLFLRHAPPAEEVERRMRWFKGAAIQCSERERRAESAEREAQAWKKFVFLKDRVGEEFHAYVSAVVAFGLFITLEDIYVDGLIPISALEDDFYRYEEVEHRLVGSQFGRVYRLGDRLRVKLIKADPERRTLDFKPVGTSAGPRRRSRVEAIRRQTARHGVRRPGGFSRAPGRPR